MENEKEKEKGTEAKVENENENKEHNLEDVTDTKGEEKEEQVIILRPVNMDDMRQAKNQVNIFVSLNFGMRVDFIYDFFVAHVASFISIYCS